MEVKQEDFQHPAEDRDERIEIEEAEIIISHDGVNIRENQITMIPRDPNCMECEDIDEKLLEMKPKKEPDLKADKTIVISQKLFFSETSKSSESLHKQSVQERKKGSETVLTGSASSYDLLTQSHTTNTPSDKTTPISVQNTLHYITNQSIMATRILEESQKKSKMAQKRNPKPSVRQAPSPGSQTQSPKAGAGYPATHRLLSPSTNTSSRLPSANGREFSSLQYPIIPCKAILK